MRQVQVQRRLVEEQELRLLRERHRHQHPLTFPSGELLRVPRSEVAGISVAQRALDGLLVFARRPEQ